MTGRGLGTLGTRAAMRKTVSALLVATFVTPGLALAQLNKCVGVDGRSTYSDRPCASSETAAKLVVPRTETLPPKPTAGRPPLSSEAQRHEAERQKQSAESKAMQQRVDSAAERVRQLKLQSYDPQKCAAVRAKQALMKQRDPIGSPYTPDFFELRGMESLYCGP